MTALRDAGDAQRERNKALVRRYKLEILNGRRLAALGEVAAEDYLDHAAFPGQAAGLAGFRERLEMLIRALDPRWTILDLVADADTAVVRWAMDGIHREALLGFPATARPRRAARHRRVPDPHGQARGALERRGPLASRDPPD